MSTRLFLFLAVLCTASIAAIQGVPIAGDAASKRHAQLQHLKEQFEQFKKELEEVLADGSSSQVAEIVAPVEVSEDEKRCDCEDSNVEKRCGCTQKKPTKTATDVEVEAEKKCPNDDCKKSRSKEAKTAAAAAPHPAAVQDSPIMKRFLSVLPVKHQELIEHSGSKKQFIERLLRRSHTGPNKEDMAVKKEETPEVSSPEAEESSEMTAFKRSLSTREQQLLKNHNSKAESIRGLLERKAESPKRMVDPVVAEYVQTLPEAEQLLLKAHPSAEKHLKIAILQGTNEEVPAQKRALSPQQVQDTINKLGSPSDRVLAQNHLSKIENLAKAQAKPVGSEEGVSKRGLTPQQVQDAINKLGDPADRALAQDHLSKIENLAIAESRPVGGEEEATEVVARLVKDIRLAKKGGVSLEKLIDAIKKRAAKTAASSKQ